MGFGLGIKPRLQRLLTRPPKPIEALSLDELVARSLPKNDAAARTAYERTGIAFIHIPKNAGSSVEQAIYGEKLGHRTWQEIEALDIDIGWPKFAVIRDPIDRFLSAFDYLSLGGRNPLDAEFARRFVTGKSVSEMALSLPSPAMRWFHFRPQSEFVLSKYGELMARLVRLEDLPDGLPIPVTLARINETRGDRTPRSALSPAAAANLEQVYAADFELRQMTLSAIPL